MLFAITCLDKPGHGHVRAENRSAHLAYLEPFADQLLAGGPLLAEDGKTMVGSLLIIDLPDRAAADAFCAEDPYGKAGLFERVDIKGWIRVFPRG